MTETRHTVSSHEYVELLIKIELTNDALLLLDAESQPSPSHQNRVSRIRALAALGDWRSATGEIAKLREDVVGGLERSDVLALEAAAHLSRGDLEESRRKADHAYRTGPTPAAMLAAAVTRALSGDVRGARLGTEGLSAIAPSIASRVLAIIDVLEGRPVEGLDDPDAIGMLAAVDDLMLRRARTERDLHELIVALGSGRAAPNNRRLRMHRQLSRLWRSRRWWVSLSVVWAGLLALYAIKPGPWVAWLQLALFTLGLTMALLRLPDALRETRRRPRLRARFWGATVLGILLFFVGFIFFLLVWERFEDLGQPKAPAIFLIGFGAATLFLAWAFLKVALGKPAARWMEPCGCPDLPVVSDGIAKHCARHLTRVDGTPRDRLQILECLQTGNRWLRYEISPDGLGLETTTRLVRLERP